MSIGYDKKGPTSKIIPFITGLAAVLVNLETARAIISSIADHLDEIENYHDPKFKVW